MNLKYEKGSRLLIELCGGQIFEGTYVYNNNTEISIAHVSEYPSKVVLESVLNFSSMEIAAVTVLDNGKKNSEPEEIDSNSKVINVVKAIEIADKFRYIGQIDSRYKETIDYLITQPIICLIGFGEGASVGRHAPLSFIGIATHDHVVIIDMLSYPARVFDLGLRQILQSDRIKKILNNSKSLADCLHYRYKVSLQNIFDVQVADYIISQNETNVVPKKMRSLEESISFYLGIPACVLKEKLYHEETLERPISERIQSTAALHVGYLYELYTVLLNILLSNVNKITECYAKCMVDESNHVNSLALAASHVPDQVKNLNITFESCEMHLCIIHIPNIPPIL